MSETPWVLEAQGLSKIYQEGALKTPVLDRVSFQLRAGERVAILGPSGSGKSTLLHLLGGLDEPTSGVVSVLGERLGPDANQRARIRARSMGFIYQFHHLLPEFSALENVALAGLVSGADRQEAYGYAEQLLQRMGLAHRLIHKPSELSGGERQRVAIARALANHPVCILADEPTAIWELLESLQAENTKKPLSWVMVTHDERLAAHFDRRCVMLNGVLETRD
jgi:lipoprotein-releasing system ATP-binding protein